ncbi:cysteine desulfurase family protein [uncultured Microbacterium sp.]|uniref:cysteine desulfurase family protein n=1 Tax=uncultured Microbacterium sp. TaxID=191216 RepID=UPI0025FFAF06|nr:cysteine desulfurase family protein [uncultured Microbacterium sp.]
MPSLDQPLHLDHPLYLDHAATSPLRPEVLQAMAPWLGTEASGGFGNPSSHHTVGERAAAALADARARVAAVLGMRETDVIFTSGGTEANNLAVKGLVLGALLARTPDEPPRGGRVLTTAIEHPSILESAAALARLHGVAVEELPVSTTGLLAPATLEAALARPDAPPALLVAIGHANNEIGTVQDVESLATIARAHRVPLHLDAVQSAGWLALRSATRAPLADSVAIAGHKLGAPKGTGALAVRSRLPLEPVLHGGGQERGRRSGTPDVAGAVGLATALELAALEVSERGGRATGEAVAGEASRRSEEIRDAFIQAVLARVEGARLTGDPVARHPGHASFTFAGTSGEAVLLGLERRGVISSSGSACAAGSDEPSPVLLALGIDPALAQTAVRFTFARPSTGSASFDPVALADAVAAAVADVAP